LINDTYDGDKVVVFGLQEVAVGEAGREAAAKQRDD
jgi:hypothetical protein